MLSIKIINFTTISENYTINIHSIHLLLKQTDPKLKKYLNYNLIHPKFP